MGKNRAKDQKKKVAFLSGTRADFGKIKPLIGKLIADGGFDVHIFATGMHMDSRYGSTVEEIEKAGFPNIYKFINYTGASTLDSVMGNTVLGFGTFVRQVKPDLIVVHGDRSEAMAGALVGALNNILVTHIEGGEVSGTVDEIIRHAVSKLSHAHFVANAEAKKRLVQMGEDDASVFVVGSPDLDVMKSEELPDIEEVRRNYSIPFTEYGIVLFHPVTTETQSLLKQTEELALALQKSAFNYVVIYPNNDPGTDIIQSVYEEKLREDARFALYPSMRFEYFLSLLKHAHFIIGNSSSGVREAPFYGVPVINIGSRQKNRAKASAKKGIFDVGQGHADILKHIQKFTEKKVRFEPSSGFGSGGSADTFLKILKDKKIWDTSIQKQFLDIQF